LCVVFQQRKPDSLRRRLASQPVYLGRKPGSFVRGKLEVLRFAGEGILEAVVVTAGAVQRQGIGNGGNARGSG
jgi:hypothetical protein